MDLDSLSLQDISILEPEVPYCSATSKLTGHFVDLSELSSGLFNEATDWHVKGHDFPYNFTINICSPLVVRAPIFGIPKPENISALYTDDKGVGYSLGEVASPFFRGRSLVLQYENGSPCVDEMGNKTNLRMSSTFIFKCDKDLTSTKDAVISYVAAPNSCSFFFEVRTPHACPIVNSSQSMSPVAIFVIITLVAVVVYSAGTFLYKPASLLQKLANMKGSVRSRKANSYHPVMPVRESSFEEDFS
jgi:cation-dependent mannose-6-phosphate receptor